MEEIRNKKKIKDIMYYLVKWVGWLSEYNSYEPAFHLANAPDVITAFERSLSVSERTTMTARLRGPATPDLAVSLDP